VEGGAFRSVFGARGIGAEGVFSVVLMLGLIADGEEDTTVEGEVEVEEWKGAGLARDERISERVDGDVNVGRTSPTPAPARRSTSGRTASIESRGLRFRSKCGDRGEGLIATSVEMSDGFFDNE
jgi:hypothetical protein